MIGLIQRVSRAEVSSQGRRLGRIGQGTLALIGIRRGDDRRSAERLLERLLAYRIFPDESGRMNVSLREAGGGLLLVPQFTLAADTHKGTRAGFSPAASPEEARSLFAYLVEQAQARHAPVAAGEFGAQMQIELVNDGPVTFWLETSPAFEAG